jgi:hypothetical protein
LLTLSMIPNRGRFRQSAILRLGVVKWFMKMPQRLRSVDTGVLLAPLLFLQASNAGFARAS